jgi:hypothetical protein
MTITVLLHLLNEESVQAEMDDFRLRRPSSRSITRGDAMEKTPLQENVATIGPPADRLHRILRASGARLVTFVAVAR